MKPSSRQVNPLVTNQLSESLLRQLQDCGVTDEKVLRAIREIPRHIFVDDAISHRAYDDSVLPIGFGQTISKPSIVGLMTQMVMAVSQRRRVLEIGTGCGYQTAVLSRVFSRVYTVERIGKLVQSAKRNLEVLGVTNVDFMHGDGNFGWIDHAPYDAVVVTAGADLMPDALMKQTRSGGRIVAPIGSGDLQNLVLVTRVKGRWQEERIQPVKFVPLLSGTR